MKTLILSATVLAATVAAQAQYSIDWWSIDGGGGRSTGGVFTLTGTIGQPDAGLLTGGNYTLQGGFWGVVAAIQTPGAPTLSITQVNSVVTISWPKSAEAWALERALTLSGNPIPWVQIASTYYQTNASNYFVRITNMPPVADAFFRLRQ